MSSLVVRNLSNQIVEVVRDRILTGAVPADLPIKQDALAAELGVSKIPLREALARLEQEGLLRSEANRGFFLRALSAQEAEEVFALRLKLEPEAVALGSARATSLDHCAAREALETLDRVAEAHDASVGAANRAFHAALFKPSGHRITIAFLERLHIFADRYVRKHLEPQGRQNCAKSEHHAMLEAWLNRDGKRASHLMRGHIGQTLKDLRRQLASQRQGEASRPVP